VSTTSTTDIALAREWVRELGGELSPALFFLSPRRFEWCERTTDSLSLTLSGGRCYGLGLGPHPPVNTSWTRCSIDASRFGHRLGQLEAQGRWDFYATKTAQVSSVALVVNDDDFVGDFLSEHAPHSEVWSGNQEIVNWFGVRDGAEWASIGALVRWESGLHVLASVATRSALRGRGFATALVGGIVGEAWRRSVSILGLGVDHENLAAQRTYERVGFALLANFTSYALP
jgi:ribosomal protein S18 acetylase RimI-like enzyme